MSDHDRTAEIQDLLRQLTAIREEMVADVNLPRTALEAVHPHHRESARNLLHYLALRRRDLRPLQLRLAALGLSSLGRAESHVLATIDAVLDVLHVLAQLPRPPRDDDGAIDFERGRHLLDERTAALLGAADPARSVRIMVTMPSEAANEYTLIHDLLVQGMDCMRINCAHDDAESWARMIEHLRRAEAALGRSCRVVMDLAGPKLRTGPLEPGPALVRIQPRRDVQGEVIAPARVWLTEDPARTPPPTEADACLPLPTAWLAHLRRGERVRFTDTRGARRTLEVVDTTADGCWAELTRTAYVSPGTTLRHERRIATGEDRSAVVGDLPTRDGVLLLQQGDLLIVTRDATPGRPAILDSANRVLTPAQIGCTIPDVFDNVTSGDAIWFDDGRIGGLIESIGPQRVSVRITRTPAAGGKLRADKGINLPDSDLTLGALTAKDLEDLAFVARHADVVELSFANRAADVEQLQEELARSGREAPALVLKIETRHGFENLPDMLLTAMRSPSCGVMIARGDLAVECGFERLAEVQEEILWVCEAAHVPVIWATQVLETLAKEGMPSRAEITDAAMGDRAECVMLNKGPHVLQAVKVLDNILRRMQSHQEKKRSMLRELRLAHGLPGTPAA